MRSCRIRFNEKGTFTIWAIGLCITLFMIGGFSVDLWRAFSRRRILTEIADSAARSGANNIDIDQRVLYGNVVIDSNKAKLSAKESIENNVRINNVYLKDMIITIDQASNEIDVEINSNYSFFLLGFFPGASDTNIKAHARARPVEGQ